MAKLRLTILTQMITGGCTWLKWTMGILGFGRSWEENPINEWNKSSMPTTAGCWNHLWMEWGIGDVDTHTHINAHIRMHVHARTRTQIRSMKLYIKKSSPLPWSLHRCRIASGFSFHQRHKTSWPENKVKKNTIYSWRNDSELFCFVATWPIGKTKSLSLYTPLTTLSLFCYCNINPWHRSGIVDKQILCTQDPPSQHTHTNKRGKITAAICTEQLYFGNKK